MTERFERQPLPPLNWGNYNLITVQVSRVPETGNHSYAGEHGVFEDPRYKKWKHKPYFNYRITDFNPRDIIERALILSHHLPWVAETGPFTAEMGDIEANQPNPKGFTRDDEKHVNALRFAYQQATLKRPIFTRFELDLDYPEIVPNQEFQELWEMTGPERVAWCADMLMSKARFTARTIERDAHKAEIDGVSESEEFIQDVMSILSPFLA